MKTIFLLLLGYGLIASTVFAQITVTESDMPVAGDTLRVSLTNDVPSGYAKTGLDTTWNYAALEALSQRVDTFVSATSTPSGYQLFFVLLGGANLASPLSDIPVPGMPVSLGFTFYKNSASSFSDLGSAYTVEGVPLPAKYDVPDKLYQFPMTPGLTWISTSSFAIAIPGLASYSTQRTRNNLVDGWGTIITPYGTFQTLRVKSTLALHDSIYIDSLGTGFPINRNIIEYKWLTNNEGIPVLQINEEGAMVTAVYRDFYRMSAQPLTVSLGPDTSVLQGTELTLHAIVTGGTPPYQILWNTLDTGNTLTVTILDTVIYSVWVVDELQNVAFDEVVVSVKYPPGIKESASIPFKVYPNPAQDHIRFSLPDMSNHAEMQVMSSQGKVIKTLTFNAVAGEISTGVSGLPDGIYLIRLLTRNQVYQSKFQIIH